MSAGSGRRWPDWFASYDLGASLWKTSQASLFTDSETFSETWPPQGMTRSGRAYALPMLVPPTSASGSISSRGNGSWPTPTEGDASASGSRNLPGSKAHAGVSLTDAVTVGNSSTPRMEDWRTQSSRDWKGPSAQSWRDRETGDKTATLPDQLQTLAEAEAVQSGAATPSHWPTPQAYAAPEGMSKPSSTPLDTAVRGTVGLHAQASPSKGGKLRASSVVLNPAWVSILMGYPPGWCDIGDVSLPRSGIRSSLK